MPRRYLKGTPLTALDRLAAALERAERELDEARATADGMARAPYGEFEKMRARAEKAERALAELVLWQPETAQGLASLHPQHLKALEAARAALRPSEKASDE